MSDVKAKLETLRLDGANRNDRMLTVNTSEPGIRIGIGSRDAGMFIDLTPQQASQLIEWLHAFRTLRLFL